MEPQVVHPFSVKKGEISCACLAFNDQYIAAGSSLNSVLLFPLSTTVQFKRFNGHINAITSIQYSSQNDVIISGSEDETVRIWKQNGSSDVIKPDQGPVLSITLAKESPIVLVASEDGFSVYNYSNPSAPAIFSEPIVQITCAAITPDGSYIFIGTEDREVLLYEVETKNKLLSFPVDQSVTSVAISPIRTIVAIGTVDGSVSLFNWKTNDLLVETQLHLEAITALDFHPSLDILLSGSIDNTIKISTLSNEMHEIDLVFTLTGHSGAIETLSFVEDGSHFVSAATDQCVFYWSMPDSSVFLDEQTDEDESKEQSEEIVEDDYFEEEEEIIEEESMVPKITPAEQEKISLMQQIIEQISSLSEAVAAMNERLATIDHRIEIVKQAQSENVGIVRHTRK